MIIKKNLSSLSTKKAWLWSSFTDVGKLFFIEKTLIILVSLHNGMTKKEDSKTLVGDRPMTYAFWGDLHLSQCFLVFYKKTGWSLSEMFFKQNYCHACHTRFVIFFPLLSCHISSLLADCGCVSTTIIPLCTLPVEPFFRLLDFGALTKDSTVVNLCWACSACC